MKVLLCFTMFGLSFSSVAQESKEKFFSHLYFPFDFGVAMYSSESLHSGGLTKTGLEYRFHRKNAFFIRFNFDNRSTDYKLKPGSEISNIENGTIQFNDLVIGPGYRFGNGKWQFTSLFQLGNTNYSITKVEQNGSNFKGVSSKRNIFISKASIGVEYYLFETVALTFETSHLYHWQRMDFFKENSNGLMWSIGITTTLF